ncbi:MAG: DUF1491 family protein [Salaquimonas sp.]
MRLKSSIFVSALIRQEVGQGSFAVVLNKGSEEAGAIFVVHLKANNQADIYGPAPQTFLDDQDRSDRFFECIGRELNEEDVRTKMEMQLKFDPDCWIVEIEKNDDITSLQIVDTKA